MPEMNLTSSEKCAAAETLMGKGQFEDAEYLLDQVLDSHPQDVTALNAKSGLLARTGKIADAKHLLKVAYEIDPESPAVLTNLANLALLENRTSDALDFLKQANDADPDYLAAVLLRGQVHNFIGERGPAAEWLTKASELAPGDAEVLAACGKFELEQQKFAEALAMFEKALELRPDNVAALTGMARLRCMTGEFSLAGELAKKAHLQAPQNVDVTAGLAQIYLLSGALSEAQKLTDRIKKRYADYAPVVMLDAEIAIARGETARALADCAAWLRKAPQDQSRLLAFLKLLKSAGNWEQLLAMCEKLPGDLQASDPVTSLREEALLALGRVEESWRSWSTRRALPVERPDSPVKAALPPYASLPDELVLMRFANAWARSGPVELGGKTPLASVWERLECAEKVQWQTEVPKDQRDLLADLCARTILHVPEKAAFNPYLAPAPVRRAAWDGALPKDRGPRIGVFWQGRPPGLLIDHMQDFLSDLNIVPVSLQFDDSRHQLRTWPGVLDAGKALESLGDLVNLIDCLDMVVGPDGLPLHIAGALGRPGIALLQENHEWYWAGDGTSSLWYPSVKRIVTPVGPDWAAAKPALRAALEFQDA
ncbi:tetratricopeptide repeat protein [Roseibium sp. HPY-6]|uniref:tetratricopeptide repeat protein n=1 Tax=Roseibium sp. HPY-6 TaxID=3229852 RepID=UPI00338E67D6